MRWGFPPSRLAGMNREGCFADTVGAPEHGGGHPGGWEPGAPGTGSASADGRLGPGDAPVATQVRPGRGSAGLRSQSEPLPVRPAEAPPRVAVPLSHAASSRCGRLAPSHLLRARLAWHIEEQLEVTPPSALTGARAPAHRSEPQRARWIRGRHLHLELRCSFSLKGHGEGPGVSVLKGCTPPGERAPEDEYREPCPHGPACLRGRGWTEGCGLAGWARGQRPGLLTLRGTAERASGLGRHVARLSEAGLLRQRPGSRARRARWTPVGRARGPSSPWAKGLSQPWLPPETRGGRNSQRPPPPGLTVVRSRDSRYRASPEATKVGRNGQFLFFSHQTVGHSAASLDCILADLEGCG